MSDEHVEPPAGSGLPVTSRRIGSAELEAVIRRAIELQSDRLTRGEEGLSQAEVMRIGEELGLDPSVMRQALAEAGSAPKRGALDGIVGVAQVRASRVVPRAAAGVAGALDRYLRDVELMLPQRRLPGVTRYVYDSSIAAGVARLGRVFTRTHQPLNLKQLDVTVSPLDGERCIVELSVDMKTTRGALIAGVFGTGSVLAGGWAATVLLTPLSDPLALLAVPALAGAWGGTRAIHRTLARTTEDKLEVLLDRVQHDEIG